MPSRRNFLKGLAAGAVALGIGTVEAVKAAPVVPVEKSGYAIEQEHIRRTVDRFQRSWLSRQEAFEELGWVPKAEIEQSWLLHDLKRDPAIQDLLRKQVLANLAPTSYSYVDPTAVYPVWEDGQLSEIRDVTPDRVTFTEHIKTGPGTPYFLVPKLPDLDT